MKKATKKLCSVIAAAMAISLVFSGCGKSGGTASTDSSAAGSSTSQASASTVENPYKDPVTLSWYFPSNTHADANLVYDEFNRQLKEKMNTTIDFKPTDWGAWKDKISVLIASGDPWDIVYSSYWLDGSLYAPTVAKGAFLPLDDLLAQYAPTINAYPKSIVDGARVNGKLYGVINMQAEFLQYGVSFLKDIVDELKLGDTINNAKSLEDLEPVFAAVHKAYPDMYILDNPQDYDMLESARTGYVTVVDGLGLVTNVNNPELKVVSFAQVPERVAYQKLKQSWFEKGYWKKDALTLKDWNGLRKSGKVFTIANMMMPGGLKSTEIQHGGKPMIEKPLTDIMAQPNTTSTMSSVNAQSKNPVRAVQFLEKMNTDKDLYRLLCFGIEKTHYTKVDDITVEIPTESKYNPNGDWMFGNTFNSFVRKGQPADVFEQTKKLNEEAKPNPMSGFVFNPDPVKTEIANVKGVIAKYAEVVMFGYGDQDKLLKELYEKEKAAGLEKVIAEAQKQLDVFVASKKK